MGVRAAPAARNLARGLGVNIETVQGTGKNGTVCIKDVEKHAGVEPVEINVRKDEARPVLNHMKDDALEIDGMRFSRPERGVLDNSKSKRLDIPQKYLNIEELHYHWVTDDGGSVERLRDSLGYAEVPNIKTPNGKEILTRRRTGSNKDGSTQYQQLMATPISYRNERLKEAEENRLLRERGTIEAPTDEDGVMPSGEYYIHESSSITHK